MNNQNATQGDVARGVETPARLATCRAMSLEACDAFPRCAAACPGWNGPKPSCVQIERDFCISTPCRDCPADPLPCGDLPGAPIVRGEDMERESGILMAQGAGLEVAGKGPRALSALPSDALGRKGVPMARGCLDYFPAALAYVAEVSRVGNEQHNPGQEMHHARDKSTDHADCIVRHLMDRGTIDPCDGMRHTGKVAWRALALLQEELEAAGVPLARGARVAPTTTLH